MYLRSTKMFLVYRIDLDSFPLQHSHDKITFLHKSVVVSSAYKARFFLE